MKSHIAKLARPLVFAAIIALASFGAPFSALAAGPYEYEAEEFPFLGDVVTAAVTGPIMVGGILYIPGEVGGAEMAFLGDIVTPAVTGPILVGGILYIPGEVGGLEMSFLGTVETAASTGPNLVGGILYIPPSE